MARIWMYEGHISELSFRKNYRGETIIETMVLRAEDEEHVAPVMVNVAPGLFDYIEDLEENDDEERYLKKRFWYNDIMMVVGIEVLNQEGETCKAVFDATASQGWAHKTFGPEERITAYKPEALDAQTQASIRMHIKGLRHGNW